MDKNTSIVVEEYLQLIYRLQSDHGSVKASNLSQRFDNSPSTVHATLNRMKRDGWIEIDSQKNITLTPSGEVKAKDLVLRHNLAEFFLCNHLGIPWHQVHLHAHKLEHAMTPLVTEKLAQYLNFPEACPHGMPSPGLSLPKGTIALNEAKMFSWVKVVMIDESLEDSEDMLKYLHDHQIIPGKIHKVLQNIKPLQTLTLEIDQKEVTLPFSLAEKIKVIQHEKT